MPDLSIHLHLTDEEYRNYQNGLLEACGMLKDSRNKRIVKHIPASPDTVKEWVSKAIDYVRGRSKETIVIGCFIVVGGVIVGVTKHAQNKKRLKIEEQFGLAFYTYMEAAQNGTLALENVVELKDAIVEFGKRTNSRHKCFGFPPVTLYKLLCNIHDFTVRLAEANGCSEIVPVLTPPSKEDLPANLISYLDFQKQIFEKNH